MNPIKSVRLPPFSLSHLSAGLVAVLVAFSSSAVLVFQAAAAAGASQAIMASWLWALGLGMGLTTLGLSLHYRTPILTAWSTPGAALLVTSLPGMGLSEATGAFMLSGLLITLCGLSGWFEKGMRYIPPSLAAAMLAGVLLPFGLHLFTALQARPGLVLSLGLVYLLARRYLPRHAILLVALLGILLASRQGLITLPPLVLTPTQPLFSMPTFSLAGLLGVALPLFLVTMSSQNLPGIAVLRAHGYTPPVSPLISWTGMATLVLAPFGGYALNLAAITAAICMGKESDPDPARRYLATLCAAGGYLLLGMMGAGIVALFMALPVELVQALAGLALLGTLASSLHQAMAVDEEREAALITFLTTASGMTLAGIGAPFWGLLAGLAAHRLLRLSSRVG